MPWLLNCGYLLLVMAAFPVLSWKAWKYGKYRNGWREKFGGLLPALAPPSKPRVWFHAVSVGEVNLLPGIVRQLKASLSDIEVVVTTTTDTGMEVARKHFPQEVVAYCPLDFSWAVNNAFQRIKPTMLVLAELELWPNLIATAKRNAVPVAVVNARLGDRSYRGYRRIRWLLRPMLRSLSLVAAQDEATATRFRSLGIETARVVVTGSVKFDGAPTNRNDESVRLLAQHYGARPEQQVFIAGSTIDPEEIIALETFRKLSPAHPELRLIIVPRHPERFEQVATLIADYGYQCIRRSQTRDQATLSNRSRVWRSNEVILVDTVGELRAWWGLAQIAFVGGSMGSRGGQNMLEPAGYGAAVAFGPDTKNFRDIANRLLEAGAATRVADEDQLLQFVRESVDQPQLAAARGARAQELVLSGRGATVRTIDTLKPLINQGVRSPYRAAA